MSEHNLDPELTTLAESLARLQPRPAGLDRDAVMFRAGRASAPRGWKWPLTTVASTLVAVGLGVALFVRPQPAIVERTVTIQVPAASTPSPEPPPLVSPPNVVTAISYQPELPPSTSDYQRLQEHLLRWGFDGLPPVPSAPPLPKETPDSLFRSL